MKKILFILLLGVIFITSCSETTKENSVANINVNEAIEILAQPQDTIIMIQFDNYYYEIDDDNQIKVEYILVGPDDINIKAGSLVLTILIVFIFGLMWRWAIFNN